MGPAPPYSIMQAGMSREEYELWRAPVGSFGPLLIPGKILFSGEAACRRINGYMPSERPGPTWPPTIHYAGALAVRSGACDVLLRQSDGNMHVCIRAMRARLLVAKFMRLRCLLVLVLPGGYAAGERSAKQVLLAMGRFGFGDPDQVGGRRRIRALQ
jgi:hypothetical protein